MSRITLLFLLLLCGAESLAAQGRTERYDDTFRKYTKRFFGPGFDWRLFKAQSMTESNLSSSALSTAGARGIMQLMPSTYFDIQSRNPDFGSIDDPESNIAAGIYYNRRLWRQWDQEVTPEYQRHFMFGSYNAGRATLVRAQAVARERTLDPRTWPSIEAVAPLVPRWRHQETLAYVRRIGANLARLDGSGRVQASPKKTAGF